jgi:hypothetical protein
MAHPCIDLTVINAIAFLVDADGALIIRVVGIHLKQASDERMRLCPFPETN